MTDLQNYICVTCGTQFSAATQPPSSCPICNNERQYLAADGQRWATLAQLSPRHKNVFQRLEPQLMSIGTEPKCGIGQRAQLLQTAEGNVLWDCIAMLDAATIDIIKGLGGLRAIAISHPHLYTTCVEWSRAFGDIPVYLHSADREWMMRPDPAIQFWEGETLSLFAGLTLIRCGGHFAGSQVLHWPQGDDGRGALLTGDTINVSQDRHSVSFMYSYPNLIPLSRAKIERIVAAVAPYPFERIYGGFWGDQIEADAKAIVARSAERYIRQISDA